MALNYTSETQTLPNPHHSWYQPLQPSPAQSTSDSSPTSPRLQNYLPHQLPHQHRQLRPPKTPLYVPAVLRMTEPPVKHSPPTPPESKNGSLEGLDDDARLEALLSQDPGAKGQQSKLDLALQREILAGREELGEVTGSPKKDHWRVSLEQADQFRLPPVWNILTLPSLILRRQPATPQFAALHLDCSQGGIIAGTAGTRVTAWNYLTRIANLASLRYSHIFCSIHSPRTIPLDQDAQFHPDGEPSRACEHCWRAYERWEVARKFRNSHKRTESGNSARAGINGSTPSTPITALSRHTAAAEDHKGSSPSPQGWQWSTF